MYKKILVPLDGSSLSECSLSHVRAVAGASAEAEVTLFMAVEPVFNPEVEATARVGRDLMSEVENANQDKQRSYLEGVADRFRAEGIRAQAVLEKGKPLEQILDFAQKDGSDLIIMSTHGRSGPTRWLLGSVTEKVVRHSPIPVMTITPAECRAAC